MISISPPTNEQPSLCAACGGACCLTRPGIESPERFSVNGMLAEELRKALVSGEWVLVTHYGIPYHDGRERHPGDADRIIRYPRPATRYERNHGAIFADAEISPCVFLTGNGCRLPFGDRPRMCRELEPDVCFECDSAWTRLDAALDWLPRQSEVEAALRILGETAG